MTVVARGAYTFSIHHLGTLTSYFQTVPLSFIVINLIAANPSPCARLPGSLGLHHCEMVKMAVVES